MTKVISSPDEVAKLQLKKQIENIPLCGTKYLARQLHAEDVPQEYREACLAELEKRRKQLPKE